MRRWDGSEGAIGRLLSTYSVEKILEAMRKVPLSGSLVMLAVGLVAGIVVGVMIERASLDYFLEKIFPSVAILLGAFLGASLAFELQWRKEQQDLDEQKIVAANIAIFTLAMQANALHNLKTQYVDPYRGNQLAFLDMPPASGLDSLYQGVDARTLTFLLQTPDPNLLGEIAIASNLYLSTIMAFKDRAKLHLEELQPRAEQMGLSKGEKYEMEDLKRKIGERLWVSLQQATTQCMEFVDSTLTEVERVGAKLRAATLAAFPNPEQKVIGFSMPSHPGKTGAK